MKRIRREGRLEGERKQCNEEQEEEERKGERKETRERRRDTKDKKAGAEEIKRKAMRKVEGREPVHSTHLVLLPTARTFIYELLVLEIYK